MLTKHIQSVLPTMAAQIDELIESRQGELDSYGDMTVRGGTGAGAAVRGGEGRTLPKTGQTLNLHPTLTCPELLTPTLPP